MGGRTLRSYEARVGERDHEIKEIALNRIWLSPPIRVVAAGQRITLSRQRGYPQGRRAHKVSGRPASVKTFQKMARADPSFADLPALEAEFYGESDRASAILMSALVEGTLENALRKLMRGDLDDSEVDELFEGVGVASTFSGKTKLAYAFSLIGAMTRDDLDLVRIIRNEFAHSKVSLKFSRTELDTVCQRFHTPEQDHKIIPDRLLDPHSTLPAVSNPSNGRHRYIVTCWTIATQLIRMQQNEEPYSPRASYLA